MRFGRRTCPRSDGFGLMQVARSSRNEWFQIQPVMFTHELPFYFESWRDQRTTYVGPAQAGVLGRRRVVSPFFGFESSIVTSFGFNSSRPLPRLSCAPQPPDQ